MATVASQKEEQAGNGAKKKARSEETNEENEISKGIYD